MRHFLILLTALVAQSSFAQEKIANLTATSLVNAGGTLFFLASSADGIELWRSDGTPSGTQMVKDINPGGNAFEFGDKLYAVGSSVYFAANDGTHGAEPWKSDGTEAGTVFLGDINPGVFSSKPTGFVRLNDDIFFSAADKVFATVPTNFALWKTDGTAGGTGKVVDLVPNSDSPRLYDMARHEGALYFFSIGSLWRSNGNASGTVELKGFGYEPDGLISHSTGLYFRAATSLGNRELWRSDGTGPGTQQVAEINPAKGASILNIVALGDTIYFSANDGVHGSELWRSDGTANGTYLVSDVRSGSEDGVGVIFASDRALFFQGPDPEGESELWTSNGTDASTHMVKNIFEIGGSNPQSITNIGPAVVFAANDFSGSELWQSDGTTDGTFLVMDIDPAGASSPENFTLVEKTVFFTANDGTGPGLWMYSPTILSTESAIPDRFGEELSSAVYPNPADTRITVEVRGLGAGDLRLSVHDLLGRTVDSANIDRTQVDAGFEFSIDITDLPIGLYAYQINSINKTSRGTFLVVR